MQPAALKTDELQERRQRAGVWFEHLRNAICEAFEGLEDELTEHDGPAGRFTRKTWERPGGGGGTMSLMKGRVFEKVGVNISTVYGQFSDTMRKEIPGADKDPNFWAAGI